MTDIFRRHEAPDGVREAVYSSCEKYRYSLTVQWGDGRRLLYVMLNPSKATELTNDPTIERCERRARQLGYGGFRVVNLFGLRETSPIRLKKARRPEGIGNMDHLRQAAAWSDDILAAWGVHGAHLCQGQKVEQQLRSGDTTLLCLGVTKDGHPRHPLYVPYKTKPLAWD